MMTINRITQDGFWIRVFDSKNHLIAMRASGFKEVVAYNHSLIVVQEKLHEDGVPTDYWGLLEVFDARFRRISSTLLNQKKVIRVTGENILVKDGNWHITYNKYLRPIRMVPL